MYIFPDFLFLSLPLWSEPLVYWSIWEHLTLPLSCWLIQIRSRVQFISRILNRRQNFRTIKSFNYPTTAEGKHRSEEPEILLCYGLYAIKGPSKKGDLLFRIVLAVLGASNQEMFSWVVSNQSTPEPLIPLFKNTLHIKRVKGRDKFVSRTRSCSKKWYNFKSF